MPWPPPWVEELRLEQLADLNRMWYFAGCVPVLLLIWWNGGREAITLYIWGIALLFALLFQALCAVGPTSGVYASRARGAVNLKDRGQCQWQITMPMADA